MSCGIHLTELDYILAATNSEFENAYLRWRKSKSMGSPYRVDEIWKRNRNGEGAAWTQGLGRVETQGR